MIAATTAVMRSGLRPKIIDRGHNESALRNAPTWCDIVIQLIVQAVALIAPVLDAVRRTTLAHRRLYAMQNMAATSARLSVVVAFMAVVSED